MRPVVDLKRRLDAVKRRVAVDAVAIGAPVVAAMTFVAWRLGGWAWGIGVALILASALAVLIVHRSRAFDFPWLTAKLDARLPLFEDSAALLLSDRRGLTGLAALQRDRLESRLADAEALDLRPAWSTPRIAVSLAAGLVVVLAAIAWPTPAEDAPGRVSTSPPAEAAPLRITGARLRIVPPAYTGLPAREQAAMDARVPTGSRVDWIVDLSPRPAAVSVDIPGSAALPLVRRNDRWSAARVIDQSILHRITAPGLPRQRLHRIEAIADSAPSVALIAPNSQLVLVTPGQRTWAPVFEASDDYGVSDTAVLRVTVTRGDGETITVEERTQTVRGRGEARRKRFTAELNLAREGLEPGGDLIVQLIVRDNRAPRAQETAGPSVILRWSRDLGLADGLDGMAAPVMPAYFASQRQIIIDTEALIAERARLSPDVFLDRSNALGVDQARLRLRYGQFLGEEAEGLSLPTNDAPPSRPALPTNDAPAPVDDHAHEAPVHDHVDTAPGFGSSVDVLNQFGHAHDSGDAATLFDPGTRSTLSQALDAMWSSERALRQGRPQEALPHAYRALDFLKDAQQATRIFLPRLGSQLPPVDFSRRLTGDRDDIVVDRLAGPPARTIDPAPGAAWRALEGHPGATTAPRTLDDLERWARANGSRIPDPLGLAVAIDTVRAEPDCVDCLHRLRAALWRALEPPPAAANRRDAPGARGGRYLDALQ
jgi:hypothetical protein